MFCRIGGMNFIAIKVLRFFFVCSNAIVSLLFQISMSFDSEKLIRSFLFSSLVLVKRY